MLPRETNLGRDGSTLAVVKHEPLSIQQEVPHTGVLSRFIDDHFTHFNAGTLQRAADAYIDHLAKGGLMFVSMAGAMSTGELGKILAPMIRAGFVSGMSVTGANLEEDLFNLVAHDSYEQIPHYHDTTPKDDQKLFDAHKNRVTDTAIPEQAAMTPIEDRVIERWKSRDKLGVPIFPHQVLYDLILSGELRNDYQIDPKDSWLVAAAETDMHLCVPGWEDSTLGNVFAAQCLDGELKSSTIRGGIDYMQELARWYQQTTKTNELGFFQIGGGIAGDFSICVVPLLQQDAKIKGTKLWSYFCQVTDADESMGGYSGALPTEKITWGKIAPKTPAFNIKGDASICVPLIFAKVLGW